MNLEKCRVLVAGAGISGIGAVHILAGKCSAIVLYDSNISLREEKVRARLPADTEVKVILGILKPEELDEIDLCILSPGISLETPFVKEIREKGIPIMGELELAVRFTKGRIAAITGTNGKTTTTALVGQIMKNHTPKVFVVGNIGTPFTQAALKTEADSVTVVEASSFQLETAEEFRPDVSAILNLSPDHLDRHKTLEQYIAAKVKITKNQREDDSCILNYDDPVLRELGKGLDCKVIYFSSSTRLPSGWYLDGDKILYKNQGKEILLCRTTELNLIGRHNYENIMASAAIGMAMGVSIETIRKTVKEFKAVEHRIEFVAEKNGVFYYNDSKGTNPDAAIKGIKAMTRPTLLIAGGYDKDSLYEEWIRSFEGKVRYMVLIGQTRDKIAAAARSLGFTDIIYAEDMEEAVKVCCAYANRGDAVLLSPACASWGMFENYEERGNVFKRCVNNL